MKTEIHDADVRKTKLSTTSDSVNDDEYQHGRGESSRTSQNQTSNREISGKSKFHYSDRSYIDWISRAILESDAKRLSLIQIIDWMIDNVSGLKNLEPTSNCKGLKAIVSSTLNSSRNGDIFTKGLHSSGRYFLYSLRDGSHSTTKKGGRSSSDAPIPATHPKFGKSFSRWIMEAIESHPEQLMSKDEILEWMSQNVPGVKGCNARNEKRWKKGVTDALRRRNNLFFDTIVDDQENGSAKRVFGINREGCKKTYHIGKGKRRLFDEDISSDDSVVNTNHEEYASVEESEKGSCSKISGNKRKRKSTQSPDRINDHEYCSTTVADVEKSDDSQNVRCENCGNLTVNVLLSQILDEMRRNSETSRELLQVQNQLLKGQQETNQRLDQLLKKISPKTRTSTQDEHDYNMDSVEVVDWELKC